MDSLRAFAGQVRGLLKEFQSSADGATTHARTGIGRGSFGTFAEANAIHDQYELMRDGLRDVLNALQEAIDEAQRKADQTAASYEDQEHRTAQGLKVTSDGWSVGSASAASSVPYASYGAVVAGAAAGAAAGRAAAKSTGGGTAADADPASEQLPDGVGVGTGARVGVGGGADGEGEAGASTGKGRPAKPPTGTGPDGNGGIAQPTW
ncbi:DUF2563 family protein [Kitasatospora mediocidica]|uniref:DUF2563 family protein n=1 Tax=Kitasatospora mediocidica TaxID=58352 RepID=UPI00056C241E|nr:DUF2563 family protein [Kitasatospora mediocidica]